MTTSGAAPGDPGRPTQELMIPTGWCRRCVRAVSRRLRDVPGVVAFELDATHGVLRLTGAPDPVAVRNAIDRVSCR
jgi:hypothetical protein